MCSGSADNREEVDVQKEVENIVSTGRYLRGGRWRSVANRYR